MFDPEFDPLQELHDCRVEIATLYKNQNELVRALNTQSDLLKEQSRQHSQLVKMIKEQKREIQSLELSLAKLLLDQSKSLTD